MDVHSALAAELARLTDYLDDPTADVERSLRLLATDARLAVPSYLGLTVVVDVPQPPLTITVLDAGVVARDVCASLAMPLAESAPGRVSALLVLYAAAPGAFVDLAADVAWLTGTSLERLVLDGHLDPIVPGDSGAAWQAASLVDQAVGVLLARGRTPEEAVHELDGWARATGGDRPAAARHVLDSLPTRGRAIPVEDDA